MRSAKEKNHGSNAGIFKSEFILWELKTRDLHIPCGCLRIGQIAKLSFSGQ